MTGIYTPGYRHNRSGKRHNHGWKVAGRVYQAYNHTYLYRHVCLVTSCPATREAQVSIPEPKLTETVHDQEGMDVVRKWMCDPPAPGQRFSVTACDWGHDPDTGQLVRLIYKIQELP